MLDAHELSYSECQALLRAGVFGRIAVSAHGRTARRTRQLRRVRRRHPRAHHTRTACSQGTAAG